MIEFVGARKYAPLEQVGATCTSAAKRTRFHDIYPGIDVDYYRNHQDLEFDLNVHPGADPSQFRLHVRRAASVISATGDLIVASSSAYLRLRAPEVYQLFGREKRPVASSYRLAGQDTYALQLAPYDRARLLVIDPVLTYSGTFGAQTTVTGIASDSAGNAYITGFVGPGSPTSFPLTPGALKTTTDYPYTGFVTKLNPSGDVILYSTYLSGQPFGIAADSQGQAYIAGITTSSTNYKNCSSTGPGFVLKLNSSGSAPVYGTCLTGSPSAIAIDATGAAYIAGVGNNIPVTNGAVQSKPSNAYIEKLDPSGSSLLYATYLGGSSGKDQPTAIAVDRNGNAHVTGIALSSDFPTVNPYQRTPGMSPLMRISDGGVTYTSLAAGLPAGVVPSFVATGSGNAPAIYAAIPSQNSLQLYATNNAGAIWTLKGTLPADVNKILPDPQNTATLYANGGALYKSIDGGATWKQLSVGSGMQISQLIIDQRNSSTLYVVGTSYPYAILKSLDGGSTWLQLTLGTNVSVVALAMDPTNDSTLYAIGGSAFWKSTDAGAHWTAVATLNSVGYLSIAPSNPSVMYASSFNTVLVSLDGGLTWTSLNLEMIVSFVDANDPETAYSLSSGGLTRIRLSGNTIKSTDTMMIGVNSAIFDNGSPASLYLTISASRDAFVSKLNAAGTQWVYSTYFGGYGTDIPSAIAVDPQGNAYIAGTTNSTNLPASAGAVQSTYAGGSGLWSLGSFQTSINPSGDAFLAKLGPSGSKLLACTYLGGAAHDTGTALAVDSTGNVYLAGTTQSPNFPVTPDSGPLPANLYQGGFLAQLSGDFTHLNYSGYFDQDTFSAVALDPQQDVFVGGQVPGSSIPALFTALHFGPPSALPQIANGGIVDVFTSQRARAVPGAIESIYGANLATTAQGATTIPLPLSLGGARVTIDGMPAPLFYASPNQINVQVPYETKPGVSQLVVTNSAGISAPAAMIVNAAAPNILVDLNTNRAIALNQDDTYNSPQNPAPPGSTITLFLTGQGALASTPATGAAVSGADAATSAATATIGKSSAIISYLGLTPGSVGLAQANVQVPQLPPSDYPLTLTVGGVESNWSIISIGGKK